MWPPEAPSQREKRATSVIAQSSHYSVVERLRTFVRRTGASARASPGNHRYIPRSRGGLPPSAPVCTARRLRARRDARNLLHMERDDKPPPRHERPWRATPTLKQLANMGIAEIGLGLVAVGGLAGFFANLESHSVYALLCLLGGAATGLFFLRLVTENADVWPWWIRGKRG